MKILVVDDDELMRLTLKNIFKDEQVYLATSFDEADDLLKREYFGAAFLDINLKTGTKGDGIDLLKRIRERDSYLPCVMISGLEDKPTIMRCLELGAVDYVVKGTVMPEAYKFALYKSMAWRKILAESNVGRTPRGLVSIGGIDDIRGSSPQTLELKNSLKKMGTLPGPYLIFGETGVGKELVARALWAGAKDANRPFIAVNCASLPANLVESELFGYERGAFTGALTTKTGLFEAAGGGDIFLDEIGELSLELQAKFLRVLQEKKVRRLGSDKERPIDVRVIAATNVDLMEAVNEGEFREDLFYRLNVQPIRVPTLRDRKGDIIELLEFFAQLSGLQKLTIDSGAKDLLMGFAWPGNIRQLKSFAEFIRPHVDEANAVVTKDIVQNWLSFNQLRQKATTANLANDPQVVVREALAQNKSLDIVNLVEGIQKAYVKAALDLTSDNRSQAAKILGVSRQRLSNWLIEWNQLK